MPFRQAFGMCRQNDDNHARVRLKDYGVYVHVIFEDSILSWKIEKKGDCHVANIKSGLWHDYIKK